MAHANDPDLGGCDFARFFYTTPVDLISDGLYKALAFAAYPSKNHRAVSMALLAKPLGAVAAKRSVLEVEASLRSLSSTSRVSKLRVSIRAGVRGKAQTVVVRADQALVLSRYADHAISV
jgi:hypothetical protein